MPTQQQVITKTDDDMKKAVIERIPEPLRPYLEGVDRVWDRELIIRTNIERLGYKDIILRPEIDIFGDVVYKSYCKLNSLATQLGHVKSNALFTVGSPLEGANKYLLKDLDVDIKTPGTGVSCKSIIPSHLNDKSDRNRNNYVYIDMDTSYTLINAALRRTKMKDKAKVVNDMLLKVKDIQDLCMNPVFKNIQHMDSNVVKEALSKEQENMMKEWIITKMSPKLSIFFDQVTRPWDRTELLLTNIARLGYTDIILRHEYDDFADEHMYKPYFKLNTLASMLGYSRPNDLIKPSGILSDCTKYYLKSDTVGHRIAPGEGECIIPDSLCMPSDTNKYNCIYINITACETLISSAARIPKFKDSALLFKNLLTDLNRISVVVINRLNQLVAEYRYQQQLANTQADKQKILAIEQKERVIEQKQKRLEEEMRIVALQKYPDVDIKKCHHGYIFSSPDDMSRDLFKIGITDDLKGREKSAHTYCPRGSFLYTVDIYDARSAEYTLHQVLKKYGLHRKINSGDEWFYIPGLDEAKKLLDIVASNTNDLYEHVSRYLSMLRDRLCASTTDIPMIEAVPVEAPVDETKLVNDFIKEIANKVGMGKPIYKTQLLKMLKDLANDDRYKKHKDKLPTDFDRFTNTTATDAATNIDGIKVETKSSGRQTTIRFTIEIITTDICA